MAYDCISTEKPIYFSVKLPEGNYHVKVILGDKNGTSTTTIKTECRRLMVEECNTAYGIFSTEEFIVHVKESNIRPWLGKVRLKQREQNRKIHQGIFTLSGQQLPQPAKGHKRQYTLQHIRGFRIGKMCGIGHTKKYSCTGVSIKRKYTNIQPGNTGKF